jgi:hypothetical protein
MFGRTTYPCSQPSIITIPYASQPPKGCCPPERSIKTSVGYCCPVVIPDSIQAQAESSRIASKVKTVFTSSPASQNCGGPLIVQQTTPIVPGAPIPYVPAGAPAASITVQQRAAQVVAASVNPYNPATRFSQYFPQQPLLLHCQTVKYVKADTLPSVNVCRPIQRFTGLPNALVPPG